MPWCEDWTSIRQRYEAFWCGEIIDRPLVAIRASRPAPAGAASEVDDACPSDPQEAARWFTDPRRVIPRLARQVRATYCAGDGFPMVLPVAGSLVAIQAAYLGGKYHVQSGTAWCDPILDDWAIRPRLRTDPNNFWWRATEALLTRAVEELSPLAALALPDLQGGGQILDLLRGTERLAMDLIENPDGIDAAVAEIDADWLECYRACHAIMLRGQDGYVDWLGVWSDRPAVTVECDLCTMISPEHFGRHFLPSLDRQTRMVERSIYHLDGLGAVRHLDAIMSLERLNGIQWVPNEFNRPTTDWLPLLKRIRAAGKLVVCGCGPAEVLPMLKELGPEGVFLSTWCGSPAEADALAANVARMS